MPGYELIGVTLVVVSIVYSFIKKRDRTALALMITLLVLLYLLGYLKQSSLNYIFNHYHIYISFVVLFIMPQKEVLLIVGVLLIGLLLFKTSGVGKGTTVGQDLTGNSIQRWCGCPSKNMGDPIVYDRCLFNNPGCSGGCYYLWNNRLYRMPCHFYSIYEPAYEPDSTFYR